MRQSLATAFLMTLIQAQNWSMFAQPEAVESVQAVPVVTMYTADWCGPCIAAKAALKGVKEFRVVQVDVDSNEYPNYVKQIPMFVWTDSGGILRSLSGWSANYPERILRSMKK